MQSDRLKEAVNRLEQCADDAKRCVQSGSVPADLRQAVETMHQQASQAKHSCNSQQGMGQDTMRDTIMQLEQSADRAMQACRNAGSSVDAQTQQAVQRAHEEASRLKHDMMQEA